MFKNTYHTKVDSWMVVLITVIFIGPLFLNLHSDDLLLSGLFILSLLIPCILLLYSFRYTLTETQLIIKIYRWPIKKIDLHRIHKIEETHSPISSPAGSFDRLAIYYTRYDSVLISPCQKTEFIANMLKINPDINVVYRTK